MHTIELGERAQLALDTVHRRPTRGIPSWLVHVMEHASIERLAGTAPGTYRQDPDRVYLAYQNAICTCAIDQWIPTNPLSMGSGGYEAPDAKGATQGAERIEIDGVEIDGPEDVIEHMQRFTFPRLREAIATFDEDQRVRELLAHEAAVQDILAPDILKTGYGFISFPTFAYGAYGYEGYFMAYALYPEVMEAHFALQADLALLNNRAAARAYREGGLPPMYRLDHDMTDSRGTLVDIRSLDRIWFPQLARCLEPVLQTDANLLWHCDGNISDMAPRLVEIGVRGFQGFQYEDGVDYQRICRMKARDGQPLMIIAGVSVTTTLPHGTPADVRRQLDWLVEHGPRTGLFLACSSSVTPGVPWDNIRTLIEGLRHYQRVGRDGA